MTDLNVTLTNVNTGEVEDRFSVYRGTALSLNSFVSKVRDSIRSEMDIDHFVHIAQEDRITEWETISPFIARFEVPGGWLYQCFDKGYVYVPNPLYYSQVVMQINDGDKDGYMNFHKKPRGNKIDDGEYPEGSNV